MMSAKKNSILFWILFASILVFFLFICGCSRGTTAHSGLGQFKITFHDSKVDGSTISRIDMTVIETQIIDLNGNKTTISSRPQAFNLLEVTQNNPVVLANTMVAPGTYMQIRLILDSNTTITLTDGSKYPLKVPSGERTGIKIDGMFSIPAGTFYTLDIDLDPGKSVIYTPGQGYVLKPVISITGSEVNSGNFYYSGSYNNAAFVTVLQKNGVMAAQSALNPKYLITGYYNFNSAAQKLTVVPQDVVCLGCSRRERLETKLFADVPPATIYNVVTFGADYVDLQNSASGEELHMYRVPIFSLGYVPPSKDFTIETILPNPAWAGKTIVGQIIPENGDGRNFFSVDTIPDNLLVSFDFSILESEFDGSTKNYILLIAVVNDESDLILSSSGRVVNLKNLIAHNADNAILLQVSRDELAPVPLNVPFIATTL